MSYALGRIVGWACKAVAIAGTVVLWALALVMGALALLARGR